MASHRDSLVALCSAISGNNGCSFSMSVCTAACRKHFTLGGTSRLDSAGSVQFMQSNYHAAVLAQVASMKNSGARSMRNVDDHRQQDSRLE